MTERRPHHRKPKAYTIRPNSKTCAIIDELSDLTKTSKNKLICEFLENASPHMEEIVKALRFAQDKNPEAFSQVSVALRGAIIEAFDAQTDLIDFMSGASKK